MITEHDELSLTREVVAAVEEVIETWNKKRLWEQRLDEMMKKLREKTETYYKAIGYVYAKR